MSFRNKVRFFVFFILTGINFSIAETQYLALFMSGKKVGHMVLRRDVNEAEVITSEKVVATINRFNIPITINTEEVSIETTDGEPLGFESNMELGAMSMSVKGAVKDDGTVKMRTSSMAGEQESTMEWPKGALMAEGLNLLALEKGLGEGTQYTAKIFSPGMMKALDAKITVGTKEEIDLLGRVVSLTKVTTELNISGAGNIATISYVDDEQQPQKMITNVAGIEMEMIGCTKKFALSNNDVFDVLNKVFLSSPQKLEGIGEAESAKYILEPKEKGYVLNIPTTDTQRAEKLSDSKVRVTVRPIDAPKGVRFPYEGNDKQILKALEPTRFVQSDNKQIIKLAREAVGDAGDAAEAVRRIEAFVAAYIDNKSLSVGYASAVEVAKSRKGDCSEFSILTASLCQAVGIPAKVVMGVAYVEEFGGFEDIFGGHAWVQAYVGGKWVGVDSAFKSAGLGGYGAGHIALGVGNGNPEDFFEMIETTGRFEIEKAEITKDGD